MTSIDSAGPPPQVVEEREPERHYGFSVILTGLARIGKQPLAFALVVVLNAVVQAVLTYWTPIISESWQFWLSALLSGIALVWSFSLVCRLSLATVDGKIGIRQLVTDTRGLGLFVAWVIAELVVIFILAAAGFWPGMVVFFFIPFVAIAAIDGRGNALKTNFQVIAQRWGRYLTVVLAWLILMIIANMLLGILAIVLSPVTLAFFGWILKGFLGVWLTNAFAALYRSTLAGRQQL